MSQWRQETKDGVVFQWKNRRSELSRYVVGGDGEKGHDEAREEELEGSRSLAHGRDRREA